MTKSKPTLPDAKALDAAARVIAASERVADGYRTAELFPGEAYCGEEFARFERWAIFEREWLCIGHISQVPKPRDHFTITVIEEPLIVSRDDAGELHVLSAICQHRGHPLLDGLAAPSSGKVCQSAKLLICPYHAWSYRLDGTLNAAPHMSETAPMDELRRQIRLPRIRHTVFHGLIFITFDSNAAPLEPSLKKLEPMIASFRMADLLATPTSSTVINSNWKIYQENSLEPYHTDVVHRHSHNPAPARLSEFYDYAVGDGAIVTTTRFAAAAELFGPEGASSLPIIPGLSDEQRGRILFVAILPLAFLLFEPGSVLVSIALPTGPASMTLLTFSLFTAEATRTVGFTATVEAQEAALKVIVGEDLTTQEALQRGHRSRFTPPGVFSWLEGTIPQMNGWLLERYERALNEVRS
jgi:phenylpropionate dioxygenase-like ring-hydroxylating dioxygenase large terminal subunit